MTMTSEPRSADPRFWGPRLAHRPTKKPRTPKAGVRATQLILQNSVQVVLAELGATLEEPELNQEAQPYNCSAQ